MPYGFIPFIAVIALGTVYVLVTDASVWSKVLIACLVLLCVFGFPHLPLARLFLQVGLSVFLVLYYKAKYDLF